MAGRALASCATLLIPLTLARVFDQTEYGTYKQLFLVFATLYSVALVGLSDSLYYFIPRDPQKGGRYVANAMAGLAVVGVACLAALHGARHVVAGWMKNPALADHLTAIGAVLLFTLAATVLEIVLIARKRYTWASSAYVVSDLARAAFFVLPVVFWRGLDAVLLGAVVFSALRLVVAVQVLRRELGAELRLDPGLLRGQLAYALPFALYVLVEIVQSTYHQYAVSWSFDAATFALYSVGCFQVPFVDFLATPASSVMMVRMSDELRQGRPAQALGIWLDITRKLALVFFPMVALLMITSREVMTVLFTDRYAASAPIFAVWVLSIALSVVQTDGVLRVQAQVPFLVFANVVRLALIVALMSPLLRAFGLIGPVLVTLIGLCVAKALHLLRMKQQMKLPVRDVLPWSALAGTAVVSVLSAVPALALRASVTWHPLPLLVAMSAAYALTYLVLVLAARLLEPGERAMLTRWLRVPRASSLAPSGAE